MGIAINAARFPQRGRALDATMKRQILTVVQDGANDYDMAHVNCCCPAIESISRCHMDNSLDDLWPSLKMFMAKDDADQPFDAQVLGVSSAAACSENDDLDAAQIAGVRHEHAEAVELMNKYAERQGVSYARRALQSADPFDKRNHPFSSSTC